MCKPVYNHEGNSSYSYHIDCIMLQACVHIRKVTEVSYHRHCIMLQSCVHIRKVTEVSVTVNLYCAASLCIYQA